MADRLCLIVDDEPVIRKYLMSILETEHLQALEAETAAEALKIVLKLDGRLDLIITDINMPGDMDGLDLAHSVQHTFPGIPVVLVSGFTDEYASKGNSFELIRKPFGPETILSAVRRAMNSQGGG